jgi:hypothetical protein
VLTGWSADFGDTTCRSGLANPCAIANELIAPVSTLEGTGKGTVEVSFGPMPSQPPLAITEGPGQLGAHYANVTGLVDPRGARVAECVLEYGTTTSYGNTAPCSPAAKALGSGNADVAVSAQTGLLEPSTIYHYRITALNAAGASHGEDETFTTDPALPEACPNAAIRAQQGLEELLPDCMALEQASPAKKFDNFATTPGFSANGERVDFQAVAALGEAAGGINGFGSAFVSTRGASGWGAPTEVAMPPAYLAGLGGGLGTNILLGTPDLSRWSASGTTAEQIAPQVAQIFVEGLDGSRSPLSPLFSRPTQLAGDGSSADLSHFFVSSGQSGEAGFSGQNLLPGEPSVSGPGDLTASYEAYLDGSGEPGLRPLAKDLNGTFWGQRCGSTVGMIHSHSGSSAQGAVSADGRTVFLATRPAQPPTAPCSSSLTGTANTTKESSSLTAVTTAKGTGTTSEGSNEVTELSTTSGSFLVGQTISIAGATLAPGTTITAVSDTTLTLSNPVTAGAGSGQAISAGSRPFEVGQRLSGTGISGSGTATTTAGSATIASVLGLSSFAVGQSVYGVGIPANAKVAEVNSGAQTLALSVPAGASASGVSIVGKPTITAINGQTLTLSAPATATGTAVAILAPNPLRILRRMDTPAGPKITSPIASECSRVSPPCDITDGDDEFQAASLESSKVFFTTTRQLTNSDLDTGSECKLEGNVGPSLGCDLYLYDYSHPVGERLTQVSAGDASDPERGKNAEVIGVTAISGDGSHAYFVARGVLTTTPNSLGKSAQAGKPNLYVWERDAEHPGGRTAFIGTLQASCGGTASADCRSWNKPLQDGAFALPLLGSNPADTSVGGDGHLLAFQTNASLIGEDLDGEMRDIYRYDAKTGELKLITGSAPEASGGNGPYLVSVHPGGGVGQDKGGIGATFAQQNRWVSEDGQTFAFRTREALLPGDANGESDDYLWKSGQLALLPHNPNDAKAYASVSQSGEEVAFTTPRALLSGDGDAAEDVYVARADGGFPLTPEAPKCDGEACQGPASAPAAASAAASSTFSGAGNVRTSSQKAPERKRKGHHKKKRHRKVHKRAVHHRAGGSK